MLRCGWPAGPSADDGYCDETASTVYMVRAVEIPVATVDLPTRVVALPLCMAHAPGVNGPSGTD